MCVTGGTDSVSDVVPRCDRDVEMTMIMTVMMMMMMTVMMMMIDMTVSVCDRWY